MMKNIFRVNVLVLASVISASWGEAANQKQSMWDLEALGVPPKVYEATDELKAIGEKEGLRAFFYEGLPYRGNSTRVFAWYGTPKEKPASGKWPAMVLVHGGGGTAYVEWVKLWNSRGYAAIAMDNCGQLPIRVDPKDSKKGWIRNPQGGPGGWGGFDSINQPEHDQWTYHAVADVVLAHSLIRSFPKVDAQRTGITGISWGGYLTCITAGVDSRFQFAVPVYGCGYLGDNSTWVPKLKSLGEENAQKWVKLWDPSQYLLFARMPMLWVTGTNDFAFPMDSLQKSYRETRGERTLCVSIRMPHGHGGAGENPPEILAFAESIVGKGAALTAIGAQSLAPAEKSDADQRPVAQVKFEGKSPIKKAVLAYTKDIGTWKDRKWETADATLDVAQNVASARLAQGTTVFYFMLTDERGLMVSSEHVEIGK